MRRDYRGREAECLREIVELDKIDVAGTDVILASVPKPSVGTSMEILYAWQLGKRVVLVFPDASAAEKCSPWLRYHAHGIFTSYAAACDYINALD
jgi:nucleoside 2-deoxyribosyltransferase